MAFGGFSMLQIPEEKIIAINLVFTPNKKGAAHTIDEQLFYITVNPILLFIITLW